MRSEWIVIALALGLASCGGDAAAPVLPPTSGAPGSSGALGSSGAPSTVVSASTPETSVGSPSSDATEPSTTTPKDGRVVAAEAAVQRLSTALADGDWATARQLSPVPPWSDEIFEQSFIAMEASTVLPAFGRVNGGLVDLWVAEVDHERPPSGPQTTLHCVHWRFDPEASTLRRVADRTIGTEPGFVDPTTYEGDRTTHCAAFDVTTTQPPTSSSATTAPQPDDSWVEVRHEGRAYQCRRANLTGQDYDCVRDVGGNPAIVGTPDLRCSRSSSGRFDCTEDDYYPSDVEGYEVEQVEGVRALCRSGECWIWSPNQSPLSATVGRPDFVCDRSGQCARP